MLTIERYKGGHAKVRGTQSPTRIDKKSLAKFVFLYRTQRESKSTLTYKAYAHSGALQAELIIERSPSPLPLEERPVEELTREELMELEGRRRVRLHPFQDVN
jgi:hypothetical protein